MRSLAHATQQLKHIPRRQLELFQQRLKVSERREYEDAYLKRQKAAMEEVKLELITKEKYLELRAIDFGLLRPDDPRPDKKSRVTTPTTGPTMFTMGDDDEKATLEEGPQMDRDGYGSPVDPQFNIE